MIHMVFVTEGFFEVAIYIYIYYFEQNSSNNRKIGTQYCIIFFLLKRRYADTPIFNELVINWFCQITTPVSVYRKAVLLSDVQALVVEDRTFHHRFLSKFYRISNGKCVAVALNQKQQPPKNFFKNR